VESRVICSEIDPTRNSSYLFDQASNLPEADFQQHSSLAIPIARSCGFKTSLIRLPSFPESFLSRKELSVFLRRFVNQLTDQNWFTVVLEILVVITGIFLGLQLTDWNEERKNRIEEQSYLQRILADLDDSLQQQSHQIKRATDEIEALLYLIRHLEAGTYEEADKSLLLEGLDSTSSIFFPITNFTTIREMQSSGKLILIRDLELRSAIGSLEVSFDIAMSQTNRGLYTLPAFQPFFAHLLRFSPNSGSYRSEMWEYSMDADFERIASDPDMVSRLTLVYAWIQFNRVNLTEHHNTTKEIRDKLALALDS